MYLISEDGREEAFTSRQAFSEAFFSCKTPVPKDYLNRSELIIEAKASADLIRRPKPLSLLDPFFTFEITETGWVRLGD